MKRLLAVGAALLLGTCLISCDVEEVEPNDGSIVPLGSFSDNSINGGATGANSNNIGSEEQTRNEEYLNNYYR